MTFTSCKDEVRVKGTLIPKSHTFLQSKIFHRDVIRLHFCLFEDVYDCRNVKRIGSKSFVQSESSFLLHNDIQTNTISSLIIEPKL